MERGESGDERGRGGEEWGYAVIWVCVICGIVMTGDGSHTGPDGVGCQLLVGKTTTRWRRWERGMGELPHGSREVSSIAQRKQRCSVLPGGNACFKRRSGGRSHCARSIDQDPQQPAGSIVRRAKGYPWGHQ